MVSIHEVTSFSKAILVIRKNISCFKESKELFSNDGLHCFRGE